MISGKWIEGKEVGSLQLSAGPLYFPPMHERKRRICYEKSSKSYAEAAQMTVPQLTAANRRTRQPQMRLVLLQMVMCS